MGFRYPQPDNEHAFEELCLRFYRKFWKNENLSLYGKRGQKQDGVDIHDPLCIKPVRAVQCKHHEPTKDILPSDINAEVEKAEKSLIDIEEYVIATTAKKSRKAQDAVVELNKRCDKKFTVIIHFWEDICQYADELGRVLAELIIYGENILAGATMAAQIAASQLRGEASGLLAVEHDDRFGLIENLLNERQLDLARHELKKLPHPDVTKSWPPNDQYKLLRLRAKLELEYGAFEEAARLFLEAYAVAPGLDQAKQNRVLAFSLLGDTQKAYEQAKNYISQGLTSAVMFLRLIESVESAQQLQGHLNLFEGYLSTDENINTALAHKYLAFGRYDSALDAANRALAICSDSPHAHLAAAMSEHGASVHGEPPKRTQRLKTALNHYDAALAAARDQNYMTMLPEILVNRAAVKMLLADHSGAAADFRAAVESATRPSVYVVAAINFYVHQHDFENAWKLFGLLDRTTPEGQYLALVLEHQRADAQEKRKLIDQMHGLAERQWDRAIECRFQCVQWSLELKDYPLAESYVSTAFESKHQFQAHTMRAWIRLEAENRSGAHDEATKALNTSIESVHPQELHILAQILLRLDDNAHALDLLEQLARPGVLDDDMKALITCAQRQERHDLLLRVCRELRESGGQDERLRKLEIQLLNLYAPKEALRIADELIQNSEAPSYFMAFKNMLAVRLNELDKLNLKPSALPTPAQLSPDEANLVLLPYVTAGDYAAAARFLYAQRRLYFENEHAHGRYLYFFLTYGERTGLQEALPIIADGSAVLLKLSDGENWWVIIEDDNPAASRGEFSAKSELGQLLVSRKVGDIIDLPGNRVQPQTATIVEIQSKYVRAFQDSMHNRNCLAC
jgi:tetratricopeptide (TPR) repeat protein